MIKFILPEEAQALMENKQDGRYIYYEGEWIGLKINDGKAEVKCFGSKRADAERWLIK